MSPLDATPASTRLSLVSRDPRRPSVVMAPMEGVVDWPMRELLAEFGLIDRCVTEFVRVTSMLLPEKIFLKYAPELERGGRTRSGLPVFVQLLGGQPEPMAENAALAAELGAPGIDLNFGCPAKTVNRHDGGASLLKEPERIFGVVSAVRAAVPAGVPVTAKVRLGFSDKSLCEDIALAAARGGADLLTVHARTRDDGYRPPAHWEYIAAMKIAVDTWTTTGGGAEPQIAGTLSGNKLGLLPSSSPKTHMDIVANGEIWTVDDYFRCVRESGCFNVALGRGLVARPSLALEIKTACLLGSTVHTTDRNEFASSTDYDSPEAFELLPNRRDDSSRPPHFSWPEIRLILLERFVPDCLAWRNDHYAITRLKQWTKYLARTYPEAAAFFDQVKLMKSTMELDHLENSPQISISAPALDEVPTASRIILEASV